MEHIFPALIPFPNKVFMKPGEFIWSKNCTIQFDRIFSHEIDLFIDTLPHNVRPMIQHPHNTANIICKFDAQLSNEAYDLIIRNEEILLLAGVKQGMWYALQTLYQLVVLNKFEQHDSNELRLPCLQISDQPRFRWRGFMLDEARHFQGKETVKKIIDWMCRLKMNTFHWHLTEDQGWRIEIEQYPKLVTVGSKRQASQSGGFLSRRLTHKPHSGYYSKQEILEIVRYANERHITIVPEIEMPGHSQAALAAYPELGCTGGPYSVSPYWGIHPDIYCLGKENTTLFLENVLSEVLDLFPGKYIHIGGDEAPKKRWRKCPDCQKQAEKLGLDNVKQLQTVLTNHFVKWLEERNRKLIGWNEILADDLHPDAVVQYWVGKEKVLLNHIKNGRKAILSNFAAYYLDHSYTHSPLEKVYQYEPVFSDLEPDHYQNILGIETPLWTEFVPTRSRLDWQVFPRLIAVAETSWLDPKYKSYNDFKKRLKVFLQWLELDRIGYASMIEANPGKIKQILGPLSLLQEAKGSKK